MKPGSAGTTYPIDREFTAAMLPEFEAVQNTMDSVSDRDYIIEMISAFSIIKMHLSIIRGIYNSSTKEFDFIALSDAYSTGSIISCLKRKNPDSLELVRGKTGRLYRQSHGNPNYYESSSSNLQQGHARR